MPASGKALDSGYYADNIAAQNAINAKALNVSKTQSFTSTEQTRARANIAAQKQAPALDAFVAGATTANVGKTPIVNADGTLGWAAPSAGGSTVSATDTFTGSVS